MMNTHSPLPPSMTMDMEMITERKGQELTKEGLVTGWMREVKMLATRVDMMTLKARMMTLLTMAVALLPLLKSCNPHRKPGKYLMSFAGNKEHKKLSEYNTQNIFD